MNLYQFWMSYAGFNVNDASFVFVGSVFETDPDQVMVIATTEYDNCTFNKLEYLDKKTIKVFIKDISRERIGQKVKFRFHILYSSNGKLLKQTLNYDGKSDISFPVEIDIRASYSFK